MSGTKKSGGKAGAKTGAKKSAGGRGAQGAPPPGREERRAARMQETGGVADPKASTGELTRFHKRYIDEVRAKLTEEFGYKNPMQVPRLEKIVLNMGVGEATGDQKKLDAAVGEMTLIAAQKPVKTVAKKAIAGFKIRKGLPIGCKVTLARRACMSSWIGSSPSHCPECATSAAFRAKVSMGAATSRWVSRNRSFSLRSTTIALKTCAGWISSSSRPRKPMPRRKLC